MKKLLIGVNRSKKVFSLMLVSLQIFGFDLGSTVFVSTLGSGWSTASASALATTLPTTPTLKPVNQLTCSDSFGEHSLILNSAERSAELFNYKLLYLKRNEQKRLQSLVGGVMAGQSLASVEVELAKRKAKLILLGYKDSDFIITGDDLVKLRALSQLEDNQNSDQNSLASQQQQSKKLSKAVANWSMGIRLDIGFDKFTKADFSSDGTRLLTSIDKNRVTVRNALDLKSQREIYEAIQSAHFSPDGESVIVSQERGTPLLIYSIGDGSKKVGFDPHRSFRSSDYAADGKTAIGLFFPWGERRDGMQWDLNNGKILLEFGEAGVSYSKAHISTDSTLIVTISYDDTVTLWDTVNTITQPTGLKIAKQINSFKIQKDASIEISPDCATIIVVPSQRSYGHATVYKTKNGEVLELQSDTKPTSARYSGDSETIVIGFNDGRVRFFNMQDGSLENEIHVSNSSVSILAFSLDQKSLVLQRALHNPEVWHRDDLIP